MPGTSYGNATFLGGYCWKVIVPQATTNMCLNPSAETTGNYAPAGGGAISVQTDVAKFGKTAYQVQTAGDDEGAAFLLDTLQNGATVTMYVRNAPTSWDWSLDGATFHEPQKIIDVDAD